ncbi:hypothetical protein ACGFX4_34145 [Kitasatospora sp. NPDC048365]|uniref:hypothetical protein n=1 Tax=Kitasatospora sp. NPDC048365 TaxID=3364050 RepID=UPI00371C45FD
MGEPMHTAGAVRAVQSVLDRLGKDDPASARLRVRLSAALVAVAVLLFAWILVLGSTTRGQAEVRNWSVVWIGVDLLQAAGLVATGLLLVRRSRLVALVAAGTSAVLLLDAWFDMMTAEGGGAWYVALAMAFLVELPASLALAALARRSLDW